MTETAASGSTPAVAAIEADIKAARSRLETTVNEIAYRAQPQVIVQRQVDSLKLKLDAATHTEDGELRVERDRRRRRGRRCGARRRRGAHRAPPPLTPPRPSGMPVGRRTTGGLPLVREASRVGTPPGVVSPSLTSAPAEGPAELWTAV